MRTTLRQSLPAVFAVLLIVAAWQLVTVVFDVPKYLLPSPVAVGEVLLHDYKLIAQHFFATLTITLAGFGVGVVYGVCFAILLGLADPLRRALEPLLVASQAIPPVIIAPLVIAMFGFGMGPKIMVVALAVFFPMAIGGAQAMRSTDRSRIDLLRAMGAGRWRQLFIVRLPSSLPALVSGMKIAASYVVFTAIVAEWIGSTEGLGVYLQRSQSSYQTAQIFAAVAVIAALGLVLFWISSVIGNSILSATRQLTYRKV